MTSPISVAMCGKIPSHQKAVPEALKPDYQVHGVFPTVEAFASAFPTLDPKPRAVFMGGGFDRDEFEAAYAIAGAKDLPWFRPLRTKPGNEAMMVGEAPPAEAVAKMARGILDEHVEMLKNEQGAGQIFYYGGERPHQFSGLTRVACVLKCADQLRSTVEGLLKLLRKIKVKDDSWLESTRGAARNWRYEEKKNQQTKRIGNFAVELQTHLSQILQWRTLTNLKELRSAIESDSATIKDRLSSVEAALTNASLNTDTQRQLADVLNASRLAMEFVMRARILRGVAFDGISQRHDEISDPHQDTYDHLLVDDRLFTDWLKSGNGIFHIAGKPGCGKSTLMRFLHSDRRQRTHRMVEDWAKPKEVVMADCFLWRHGKVEQRSLNGLYRSLLYKILSQNPDLILELFPKIRESIEQPDLRLPEASRLHDDEVSSIFENLLERHPFGESHRFFFLIDGLDEFHEGGRGNDHIDLVRTLRRWTTGSDRVKICVSSREINPFESSFDSRQRLRLHEVTSSSIRKMCNDKLMDEHIPRAMSDQDVNRIVDAITFKAEGVFLWVVLVIDLVRRSMASKMKASHIFEQIEQIPEDLKPLYEEILASLDLITKKMTIRVFSVLKLLSNFGNKELLLDNYYLCFHHYVEHFANDPRQALRFSRDTPVLHQQELEQRQDTARAQINGYCRGLVTIWSSDSDFLPPGVDQYVTITHRSIWEFLESSSISMQIDEGQKESADMVRKSYLALVHDLDFDWLGECYHSNHGREMPLSAVPDRYSRSTSDESQSVSIRTDLQSDTEAKSHECASDNVQLPSSHLHQVATSCDDHLEAQSSVSGSTHSSSDRGRSQWPPFGFDMTSIDDTLKSNTVASVLPFIVRIFLFLAESEFGNDVVFKTLTDLQNILDRKFMDQYLDHDEKHPSRIRQIEMLKSDIWARPGLLLGFCWQSLRHVSVVHLAAIFNFEHYVAYKFSTDLAYSRNSLEGAMVLRCALQHFQWHPKPSLRIMETIASNGMSPNAFLYQGLDLGVKQFTTVWQDWLRYLIRFPKPHVRWNKFGLPTVFLMRQGADTNVSMMWMPEPLQMVKLVFSDGNEFLEQGFKPHNAEEMADAKGCICLREYFECLSIPNKAELIRAIDFANSSSAPSDTSFSGTESRVLESWHISHMDDADSETTSETRGLASAQRSSTQSVEGAEITTKMESCVDQKNDQQQLLERQRAAQYINVGRRFIAELVIMILGGLALALLADKYRSLS